MSHFSKNYSRINYPIASETEKGLRNAQLGAIHSIAAHFTLHKEEAAIIIMPTGSGKTAVLNLSAYLLKANRVLVITSSILVRGQIVEEFSKIKTLKDLNVFHSEMPLPKVKEIKSPIKSLDDWELLKEYDVVIGIPNSINEGIKENHKPEEDFFDLILVDEAHHVPAFTWSNITNHFRRANKIFFTATPFRRDKKEIEGKVVFNYPLSKAFEDKIFGKIVYYPVISDAENKDLAIALQTEQLFKEDENAGLKHYIMVRAESKEESENLRKLYESKTKLKLKKVDSTLSYSTIKTTIKRLKSGELDGIICVDMLGEGFDFPNLKIASIHSPKKSLANTLQFIGRFARTNAENIGEAKFLAIPNDIKIGKKKLYEEGAIWNEIIISLSDQKIEEEDEIKNIVDSFEKVLDSYNKDDISFYNLNPYRHVKIFSSQGIKLEAEIKPIGLQIIYQAISNEHNSKVIVFRQINRPKWIVSDELIDIKHFILLVFFDEKTNLLFIHSTIKTSQFYEVAKECFGIGKTERISKFDLNKVLAEVEQLEFFNIGMQNRAANSGESYRTSAGPNAERSITKSLSKNYANGHVFLKGIDKGEDITIGYSTGSKVWSNSYDKIPNFIKWCEHIGAKIVSNKIVKTNSGFDNLPIGKKVDVFPHKALMANWNKDVFTNLSFLQVLNGDKLIIKHQFFDYEIKLDSKNSNEKTAWIDLVKDSDIIKLEYDLIHFKYREAPTYDYRIEIGSKIEPLISYLNDHPFTIYLSEFATIIDHEYFEPPKDGENWFELSRISSFDWSKHNTDIEIEFYKNPTKEKAINSNKNSIHETLQSKLISDNHNIIFYDHGPGEIADFITIDEESESVSIRFFHVKASQSADPGNRLSDIYEVCMQTVKSQVWIDNTNIFKKKLKNRIKDNSHKFINGDEAHLFKLIDMGKLLKFSFVIVQPGISSKSISNKICHVLASTDDSLKNSGYEPLIILGS